MFFICFLTFYVKYVILYLFKEIIERVSCMALYYIEQLRQLVNSDKWPYDIGDWNEKLNESTNCLAFALGLPYPDESHAIFVPTSSKSLESFCCNILSCTNLEFRKISSCKEAQKDELVVVGFEFISPLTKKESFHFIRKNLDGKWYHKTGWHMSSEEINWNSFDYLYPSDSFTSSFILAVKKRTSY